jgi:hypothetical protein
MSSPYSPSRCLKIMKMWLFVTLGVGNGLHKHLPLWAYPIQTLQRFVIGWTHWCHRNIRHSKIGMLKPCLLTCKVFKDDGLIFDIVRELSMPCHMAVLPCPVSRVELPQKHHNLVSVLSIVCSRTWPKALEDFLRKAPESRNDCIMS